MHSINYIQKDGTTTLVPVFIGNYSQIIPKLTSRNYSLISTHAIIEQRVKAFNSSNVKLKEQWLELNSSTSDSIIYNPDGRIKVILDSKNIVDINSDNHKIFKITSDSTIILNKETFDQNKGFEFKKDEYLDYSNKPLTAYEISKNPIWNILLREDKTLLNEYAKIVSHIASEEKHKKVLKKLPLNIYSEDFANYGFIERIIRVPHISKETLGGIDTKFRHKQSFISASSQEIFIGVFPKDKKEYPNKKEQQTSLNLAIEELILAGYISKNNSNFASKILERYIK